MDRPEGSKREGLARFLRISDALGPFISDTSPMSIYSADARSIYWHEIAAIEGILDFVAVELGKPERVAFFSILARLQKFSTSEGTDKSMHETVGAGAEINH